MGQMVSSRYGVPPRWADFGIDKVIEFARWLTDINARARQKEAYSGRVDNTGLWLLQLHKFRKWEESNGGVLWGKGIPGAGKTTLLSIDQFTLRDIVASLLEQLLIGHTEVVFPIIVELYEEHRKHRTEPSEAELTQCLQRALAHFPRAFVALDALDELPEPTQTSVIKVLLPCLGCNVFVTSRPLAHMEAMAHQKTVFVDIRANYEDVRTFICHSVEHDSRLGKVLENRKDVFEELVTAVQLSSDGMFLLAALYMGKGHLGGTKKVSSLKQKLQCLPSDLDNTYRGIWRQICGQKAEDVADAKRILSWVMYAKEPMTVAMLQHALAVDEEGRFDPDDVLGEESLIDVCCNLVTADKASKTVQLIHHTAREFLEKLIPQPEFGIHPHSLIASSCVGYLSYAGFESLQFESYQPHKRKQHHPTSASTIRCTGDLEAIGAITLGTVPQRFQTNVLQFLLRQTRYPLETHAHYSIDETCPPCDLGSPSHIAAFYGLYNILHSSSINFDDTTSHSQQSHLHLAAGNGHHAFVEQLLRSPTRDVNVQDSEQKTALGRASGSGHALIVKALLEHPNVDPNLTDRYDRTPLGRASAWGRVDCMQLLLQHPNVDVNHQDDRGWTPLFHAARWGRYEAMKLILANPATEPDIVSTWKETPLILASSFGHKDIVHLLLSYRLPLDEGNSPECSPSYYWRDNVNATSNRKLTALMKAASQGRSPNDNMERRGSMAQELRAHSYAAITRMLLDLCPNLDLNAADRKGRTAAMKAAEWGHDEVLEALVRDPRIDLNKLDEQGLSALIKAATRGRTRCVELLLAGHASQAQQSISNGSVVDTCSRGHFGCIDRDVEAQESPDRTELCHYEKALQEAQSHGHEEVIKLFGIWRVRDNVSQYN
ncbi:ankrin repeat containing protein [Coprinopsis cinerea okayama7|uniref:Ankrin repeat containing protein n=1 Tax=Coprinopsis cinerea (strain Okayama-7 / 130 / ATCC MYA-4618 / FGSC 9003) TaxID=240176 RepID=A8NBB9_COPC7|nr:ankrin repeat containing protein [Coprinopsis cinerea okayama7\|eukprot:XP_001832118.2 ankrin repeat containing protein [Coprinopsis cinerea okayama7\